MSEPAGIEIDRAVKRYGEVTAVGGVSLAVAPGALTALLGPSGCGKTTLLRLVGGFETPDAGRVAIGGRDVTALPPQRRPTAMVFQSYALFPTMTVGENVAYGLEAARRRTGLGRADVRARVTESLARVDLAGLEDRAVSALSGGQQQRVALARALAVEPAVLLFDEPLSNLDQALRDETRRELKALLDRLGTTALYVTHDQQEALALADHIAVLRAGAVVEAGTPEALWSAPETAFVAGFLGGSNVVRDAGLAARLAGEAAPAGRALAVRPDALRFSDDPGAAPARVLARQFLGTHAEWLVEAAGERLRLWAPPAEPAPAEPRVRATAHRWVRAD